MSLLWPMILTCLVGCADANGRKPNGQRRAVVNDGKQAKSEQLSANYLLGPEDYAIFRPGRLKKDILNDLQWWGNFLGTTQYEGKTVSAICYGLFGGPMSKQGIAVWAIFVDDKFEKFVRQPEWEMPRKIGEYRRLIRAAKSKPVTIADLEREQEAKPPPRSGFDPGLTAVLLIARASIEARMKKERKKNAKLRDQFNASRLEIGMSEDEVASVFQMKPLEMGDVEAGSFKIYGSTEYVETVSYLSYANVLVVFDKGKLTGAQWVPGDKNGLQKTRDMFDDLPPLKSVSE